MGAFGVVMVIIVVVANLIFAAAKARAKQEQSTGSGGQQFYQSNSNRNSSAQPTYQPYVRPSGTRPAGSASPYPAKSGSQNYRPRVSSASAEAHLCEPGSHESERDYLTTLHEMEPGYRAYIPQRAGIRSTRNQMMRLSAEEFRKKEEGLRDLRDAGIITHEEYAATLHALR